MERRPATYADLEALPENVLGQIIDGTLYATPWQDFTHAFTSSHLAGELSSAFWLGRSGPGGWVILHKPEIHLGGDVLVPDVVGWRRERMPRVPHVPAFTLAPDWVGEVLAPPTMALDRAHKLPVYAREGVRHVWLLDPAECTLEVFQLEGTRYSLLATHSGFASVRVAPFEALELELEFLWGEWRRPPR